MKAILDHLIAIITMGYTLNNIFTVEVFSLLQSIIMLIGICYSVYVYMVYWDITKN